MARYKDCDKCFHRYACAGDTDKWNYYGECPYYISAADVAPKSEIAREIMLEIDTLICCHANGDIDDKRLYMLFDELKKKYIGGERYGTIY